MKKFVEESWLVLVMGIGFALLLAGTQAALQGRIHENQREATRQAIAEVLPGVATTEQREVEGYQVYEGFDDQGRLLGWVIEGSGTGFVDRITLVVGLDVDKTRITGVKVTSNVETPGLGNKIEDAAWIGQFEGLDAERRVDITMAAPDRDDNEVQAITGATLSSVYTADIVNAILDTVRPKLEAP